MRACESVCGGSAHVPQLTQNNPGFTHAPFKFTKYSNAYMLVYIRDADRGRMLCHVDEKDIAEHLQVRENEGWDGMGV